MPETTTPHLKPPQQDRSRRTLERIVKASLELLEEEGPGGLTVQAVVARADSSVGSFYARFKGKDDLLEYLEERVWEEAKERWRERLAQPGGSGQSLEELAAGAVRLLADAHRSRAVILKSLDRMGAGGGEGYAGFRRFVLQGLTDLFLSQAAAVQHPDPQVAVRIALASLSGLIETGDPETGDPFSTEVLRREGTTLVLAYLAGAHGVRPAAVAAEAGIPTASDTDRRPAIGEVPTDAADTLEEAVEAPVDEALEPPVDEAMQAPVEKALEPPVDGPAPADGEAQDDGSDAARTLQDEEGQEERGDEDEDENVDFFDVWG